MEPYRYLSADWFRHTRSVLLDAGWRRAPPVRETVINVDVDGGDADIVRRYHTFIDDDGFAVILPGHRADARAALEVLSYDAWTADFLSPVGGRTHAEGKLRIGGHFDAWNTHFAKAALQPAASVMRRLRAATAAPPGHARPIEAAQPLTTRKIAETGRDLGALTAMSPAVARVIADHLARGLYAGAQLYVEHRGRPLVDASVGWAGDGRPMSAETVLPLQCCVKPLTAIAIARLWEQGALDIDAPVARYIDAFGRHGKDRLTLRHLLSHATPLTRDPVLGYEFAPTQEILERIYDEPLDRPEHGGRVGNYAIYWSWMTLAEVLRRVDGRDVETYLAEEVAPRLGLSSLRLSAAHVAGWPKHPVSSLYNCEAGEPRLTFDGEGDLVDRYPFIPSNGGAATARDLGRMFSFLGGLTAVADPPVSASTASQMRARHRCGLPEETLGAIMDCGLGVQLESSIHGKDVEVNSFGFQCSASTFGHKAFKTSMAFADPDAGIVGVFLTNSQTHPRANQAKCQDFVTAIYDHVGALSVS